MERGIESGGAGASRSRVGRGLLSVVCAGAVCFLTAAPSGAATTIGQLAPDHPAMALCGFQDRDIVQTTVTSGSTYVVPPYGATIVSWSTNASPETTQQYTFKVFRKLGPARFTVVAHDGPHLLVGGALNTFPVNIAVIPGDSIGVYFHQGMASSACEFIAANADDYVEYVGGLSDGSSGDFTPHGGGYRVNVSAVVKPSSQFTLGSITRNRKKGTASVAVNVPGPGTLSLSGNGVKPAAAGAQTSAAVSGPGTVTLLVKAQAKARRKLNTTGKAKVNFAVAYTPTSGDPSSQTAKVKLRRRRP
jgi:hypothetical protein